MQLGAKSLEQQEFVFGSDWILTLENRAINIEQNDNYIYLSHTFNRLGFLRGTTCRFFVFSFINLFFCHCGHGDGAS
jgi:hypothetical protein